MSGADFYVTDRKAFAYVSFSLSSYFLLSFKVICFASSLSKPGSKKQVVQVFRVNFNNVVSAPVTHSAHLDASTYAFT